MAGAVFAAGADMSLGVLVVALPLGFVWICVSLSVVSCFDLKSKNFQVLSLCQYDSLQINAAIFCTL